MGAAMLADSADQVSLAFGAIVPRR